MKRRILAGLDAYLGLGGGLLTAAVLAGFLLVGGVHAQEYYRGSSIPPGAKYGFAGVQNGLGIGGQGTSTVVFASDGGSYLYTDPGSVTVNSAALAFAAGTVNKFVIAGISATGQASFLNGAQTVGVGIDVATDAIFRVRTRAQTGDAATEAAFYDAAASSVLTITTNTIAPTNLIHHLGAGLLKTITVPTLCAPTCSLYIVPDAAYTYDATGNITLPAGGGTAVVSRTMVFVWDGTKWNPSY